MWPSIQLQNITLVSFLLISASFPSKNGPKMWSASSVLLYCQFIIVKVRIVLKNTEHEIYLQNQVKSLDVIQRHYAWFIETDFSVLP